MTMRVQSYVTFLTKKTLKVPLHIFSVSPLLTSDLDHHSEGFQLDYKAFDYHETVCWRTYLFCTTCNTHRRLIFWIQVHLISFHLLVFPLFCTVGMHYLLKHQLQNGKEATTTSLISSWSCRQKYFDPCSRHLTLIGCIPVWCLVVRCWPFSFLYGKTVWLIFFSFLDVGSTRLLISFKYYNH